jgi:hypothetical protein
VEAAASQWPISTARADGHQSRLGPSWQQDYRMEALVSAEWLAITAQHYYCRLK